MKQAGPCAYAIIHVCFDACVADSLAVCYYMLEYTSESVFVGGVVDIDFSVYANSKASLFTCTNYSKVMIKLTIRYDILFLKIVLIGCILASLVHSFLRRKPFRGVHTLSLSFLSLLSALLFLGECFWSDNAVTNTANARMPDTHTQTHTRAT